MKTLTSRDNPAFKSLRELSQDAREQRKQGLALLDGPHLLQAYRSAGGRPEQLVISETGLNNPEVLALLACFPDTPTLCLRDSLFKEISGTVNPVGILAKIAIPIPPSLLPVNGSCVVLDELQDAGNVGSIIRTAAAAGIGQVVLGSGCAGAWTPKVLRAAQGGHFSLIIREQVNLKEFLASWHGRIIATVARDGNSLFASRLSPPNAWLFGSEGRGLAPELAAFATTRVMIPMTSGSESLNVAAAAAICLFEEVRQQVLTA
jgi:RNA methyltransferase, TrmH family